MADRPSSAEHNPKKDDRGELDLTKRIDDLTNENNRLIREIGELKKDNRHLAQQIDDYVYKLRKAGII